MIVAPNTHNKTKTPANMNNYQILCDNQWAEPSTPTCCMAAEEYKGCHIFQNNLWIMVSVNKAEVMLMLVVAVVAIKTCCLLFWCLHCCHCTFIHSYILVHPYGVCLLISGFNCVLSLEICWRSCAFMCYCGVMSAREGSWVVIAGFSACESSLLIRKSAGKL